MSEGTLSELTWPKREIQAEWALLAQCLTDPGSLQLQDVEDQERLLELARLHGVGPLIYHRVKTTGGWARSENHVVSGFRETFLRAAAANLILSVQLSRLSEAFAEAEIPVLFFKGVVLASHVYLDPALRPMGDIDLIVRPEHGSDALRVVEALGYVPNQAEAFGSFTREALHARAFHRPGRAGLPIEIHNVVVRGDREGPLRDETWFWDHTVSVPIHGHPVLTLIPEVSLMQLCAHLVSHHGWTPNFIWIYDLHALLVKYQESFDWDKFTALARQLNWDIFCRYALKAARAFLRTPFPEAVLGEISEGLKPAVVGWQTRCPPTRMLLTLANFWRMPGLSTRLRFLWHTFIPTRDYMVNRYRLRVHWIWPLLYPYRWGIMLREAAKTAGVLWRVHSG